MIGRSPNVAPPTESFRNQSRPNSGHPDILPAASRISSPPMQTLLGHTLRSSCERVPDRIALTYGNAQLTYAQTLAAATRFAAQLIDRGIGRMDRVAIYAEKRFESVVAMYGAALAGAVYVPANPLLKAEQVGHIAKDCATRVLVTTPERLVLMEDVLKSTPSIDTVVITGDATAFVPARPGLAILSWPSESPDDRVLRPHRIIDGDVAAILYTSGSTGRPKGVVLSHRNIVAGAQSVSEYLSLTEEDRLLAVLPLSFDYGMNQVTSAFLCGGTAVLMNHLFAKDVIAAVDKYKITGLAAVPPLWIQLSQLNWPPSVTEHLRYITNSGGAMPHDTLDKLRRALPKTKPFLMYGLTEAFRSTYLDPAEVDRRPDSIGKAIPNAEILVVRPDGTPCDPDEPGELVHRGVHVALGYWNDPEKTAERYKPVPGQDPGLVIPELAVWSGDTVRRDEEGFLYFVGRRDEMIKTSGYRVSPTEVEEAIYSMNLVGEAAAMGVKHPQIGQAIVLVTALPTSPDVTPERIKAECHKRLPTFMVPHHIEISPIALPRNPNGKIDRKALYTDRAGLFGE